MKRQTALSNHIIQFCRFLRTQDFNIGPREERDSLEGLAYISWESSEQFKAVLKSTLVKNSRQFDLFDDLYFQYWKELDRAQDSKLKDSQNRDCEAARKQQSPSIEVIKNWLHGNRQEQEKEVAQVSPGVAKGQTDLSAFSREDMREWQQMIQWLRKYLANQPSRRWVHNQKRGDISLRPMIRANLRRGGELLDLYFKHPKEQKLKIVLLCDVSRSMELYSHSLIKMMYSLQNSMLEVETFVFSTSLYRVTHRLKSHSLKKALQSISEYVDEWSSGTKIGECFQHFLEHYGSRLLTRKTFVFIVSDGWDSGDIELLAMAMQKIKSRSRQIFWFNPLADSPDFEPQVKGMQAAMPFVDVLVPGMSVYNFQTY